MQARVIEKRTEEIQSEFRSLSVTRWIKLPSSLSECKFRFLTVICRPLKIPIHTLEYKANISLITKDKEKISDVKRQNLANKRVTVRNKV